MVLAFLSWAAIAMFFRGVTCLIMNIFTSGTLNLHGKEGFYSFKYASSCLWCFYVSTCWLSNLLPAGVCFGLTGAESGKYVVIHLHSQRIDYPCVY